jgi:hypothetical protein
MDDGPQQLHELQDIRQGGERRANIRQIRHILLF